VALYDEVGGALAVRAALDAFYPRVLADAALSRYFLGVDIERLKTIQQEYFAAALCGLDTYTGRSLRDAHARTRRRGMTDETFDHFLAVFERVLVDRRIPARQIRQWIAVCEAARGEVLGR